MPHIALKTDEFTKSSSKECEIIHSRKQVIQELNELVFNKCYVEHKGPKLLLLLKVCVEDVAT